MSLDLFMRLNTLSCSLVLLMGIAILWRRSLPAYIDSFARQSLFIVVAILSVAAYTHDWELYLVAGIVFALKVVLIPACYTERGRKSAPSWKSSPTSTRR